MPLRTDLWKQDTRRASPISTRRARGISAVCLRTAKPAGESARWPTTDCFHAAYTAMWDVPLRLTKQIVDNKILAHNIPLGVVGQIWREVGRGFPGLLTKVGLGTFMDPRYDGAMVNEKTKKEGKGPLKILRQRGPLRLSLWPDIKRSSADGLSAAPGYHVCPQ